jgi:hypothetical protein
LHFWSAGIQATIGGSGGVGVWKSCDTTELDESSGFGWTESAGIFFINADFSGDFSGDESGDLGGVSAGEAGICLNINYTHVTERSSGIECVRERLNTTEKQQVATFGPCTHKDERINPPEIIPNPEVPRQ